MNNTNDEAASEFEGVAREIFHSLFCNHAVLRAYSDSKKYHQAISDLKCCLLGAFERGRASRELKLPSEEQQRKFVELHFCYSGLEYNSWGYIGKDAIELLKKFCNEIKALNECEGKSGEG